MTFKITSRWQSRRQLLWLAVYGLNLNSTLLIYSTGELIQSKISLNVYTFIYLSDFRADLLNKTETERKEKIQKLIEKEYKFKNTLQDRVIERTKKSLKEKQALIQLLGKDYKVDNFMTMKSGFDTSQIETKHDARHYIIETRIFNSGFNTRSMRPEINRQLRKLDPGRKYRVFKKKLLEENRGRNVEINRAISDSAFRKMLKDKNNWILYNQPSERKWSGSLTNVSEHKKTEVNNVEPVKTEVASDEKQNADVEHVVIKELGDIEREKILEKRLPRRPADAFSMTMRTLGPVYFQSSAYQLSKPEISLQNDQQ